MLIVVASLYDSQAVALVAGWSADDAALLTCKDLYSPGWRYHPGDAHSSRAVMSGSIIPVSDIRGVLTLRPRIFEEELVHHAVPDRAYVAEEMNAFLLCWLTDLRCPVVNRPSAASLSGPSWGYHQWMLAAARVGIRVRPFHASVSQVPGIPIKDSSDSTNHVAQVTVIDGNCIGAVDNAISRNARRLAELAGVRHLSVYFEIGAGAPVFLGADPLPRVNDGAVAAALCAALLSDNGLGPM